LSTFPFSHIHATRPAHLIFFDFVILIIVSDSDIDSINITNWGCSWFDCDVWERKYFIRFSGFLETWPLYSFPVLYSVKSMRVEIHSWMVQADICF
jgi:hypothetical protein